MTKVPQQISLCFLEGEPALHIRRVNSYHLISYDYEEILNIVKGEIIKRNFNKRPSIKEIWTILSNQFPCCDGYSQTFNKKTRVIENSFESQFSRDITEFLDKFYKRGLTPEEKELREKEKEWLNSLYYNENNIVILNRYFKNLKEKKRRGKRWS